MTDYESTEHLTEKETGDNGCLNKLRNILKKKLERDVESKKEFFFVESKLFYLRYYFTLLFLKLRL
jgi:hypothetical protein